MKSYVLKEASAEMTLTFTCRVLTLVTSEDSMNASLTRVKIIN